MKHFSISEEIKKLNQSEKNEALRITVLEKWAANGPELSGFRYSGRIHNVKDAEAIGEDVRVHPRCIQVVVYLFGVFIQQLNDGMYVYDKVKGRGSIVNTDLKFMEEEVFNNIKSIIKE